MKTVKVKRSTFRNFERWCQRHTLLRVERCLWKNLKLTVEFCPDRYYNNYQRMPLMTDGTMYIGESDTGVDE